MSGDAAAHLVVALLTGQVEDVDALLECLDPEVRFDDLVFGSTTGSIEAVEWWRHVTEDFPHSARVERLDTYDTGFAVATVVTGTTASGPFEVPRLTVATVRDGKVVELRNAWTDPRPDRPTTGRPDVVSEGD